MPYKNVAAPFEPKRESIKWKGYEDLKEEEVNWLIDDILPARSLICLYGRRGEGKTFVALDMACSIATGLPWCGKSVRPGRVAYILAERVGGLRRRMIGWLMHSKKTEEDGNELFKPRDGRQQFNAESKRYEIDDPEQCAELIKDLSVLAPLSLLVLDPLVYFMGGSENETRAMQSLIVGLRKVSEECKCSILAVHHEGKGRKNIDLGARGSSALEAGLDTVLHLSADQDERRILRITKQREAEEHLPIHLRFEAQEKDGKAFGKFPKVISAPAMGQIEDGKDKVEERHEDIRRYIGLITADGRQATKEAILEQFPAGKRPSNSTLHNDLAKLMKIGEIDKAKIEGKKGGHYVLNVQPYHSP